MRYCVPCGGWGGHRAGCPVEEKPSGCGFSLGKPIVIDSTDDGPAIQDLRRQSVRVEGEGWCLRCWWAWKIVEMHQTPYSYAILGSTCFPLCKRCWSNLGMPERRMPYYMALVDEWELDGTDCSADRASIRKSVENGS